MQVLAPAKINLHLRVGPRRDDGFHPLSSWMCTIGLFDTLIFERARPDQPDPVWSNGITLHCDQPDLATDQENLVVRAARSLIDAASRFTPARTAMREPLSIELQKRVPAGAGLGGGSSDAARTLMALNQLWQLDFSIDQLHPLAQSLGSDVPFFLHPPSAWCTGRGEIIQPLAPPRAASAVLLLPGIHLSTPAVYKQFSAMGLGKPESLDAPAPHGWSELPSDALLRELVNDLEAPAFALEPRLSALRDRAQAVVGRPVRMSGSGSSLFTLFDDAAEARRAASELGRVLDVEAFSVALAPDLDDALARA